MTKIEARKFFQFLIEEDIVQQPYDMESFDQYIYQNFLSGSDETQAVRLMLRKEYCNVCGQELTEIRGKCPQQPRRKVCACCATEKLEWQKEQKSIYDLKDGESMTIQAKITRRKFQPRIEIDFN